MGNDWQYTNQFFEEGKNHYYEGGQIKDCPYNYLHVDQNDDKLVQVEHYRQAEWLSGFRCAHNLHTSSLNVKAV
jgi:hypothetical protein